MEQLFYEDGSLLDMNKIEFLSDRGSEYIVFKYLDSVIKIYREDYQFNHLSLKELNFLKNILTRRILLPKKTLWNEKHELTGYEMPYIKGKRNIEYDNLYSFFEELELLKQDVDLLSDNFIVLRDINLSNTIYNGHIYVIDPGSYLIDELDQIIFRTNITDSTLKEKLYKIAEEGDYSKVKSLTDSLPIEIRRKLIRSWNYNQINGLIEQLLFSKRPNIDPYKYRQIIQFLMMERKKKECIYSLDILKRVFNIDLCIGEAIDDFITSYIKDDPKKRKMFLPFL